MFEYETDAVTLTSVCSLCTVVPVYTVLAVKSCGLEAYALYFMFGSLIVEITS